MKARIRLGKWVTWQDVVNRDLMTFWPLRDGDWPPWIPVPETPLWERAYDTMMARSEIIQFRNHMERRAWRSLGDIVYT